MTIILGSICTEFQTVDIEIKSGLKMEKKKIEKGPDFKFRQTWI